MRLLLDTHALLWAVAEPEKLSHTARDAIEVGSNDVAFSACSIWELAIKSSAGRLEVPGDLLEQMRTRRYSAVAITPEHGLAAGLLPRHHRDPFDRMLVAQAQLERYTVVTRDSRFSLYDVEVLAA